jgi:aminobutyraldehyde dehydrogenase
MSVTVSSYKNVVGGEWVDSASGETMEVLNPATGEMIAEVPRGTKEDADRAVEAAKKALPEWLETTPAERAEVLLKLADLLDDHAEELAELESQNVGKPLPAARDEMPVSSDNIRFFAGAARLLEGKASGEYMRGYTSMLRREPLGVVGGITPWNYPLMMAVWKFSPALAAGNTQVLKPAEQTPLTTLHFFQLAMEAEILPPGVLNVITGDGVPVGEAIVKHPDVRLVSLTGDVETGKIIARTAADTLKRVHLELGGKAPVVVFDDADPAAVAEGIKVAGYWNSGQDCTAASRVVAGPKIYDKLLEELVPAVESIAVGDPAENEELDMGPVISKDQQERVFGFLERQPRILRQADRGHRRRPGGRDRPARGLRPGRDRAALRRRRPGDRVGQRRRLRPCGIGLDARHWPGAERSAKAAVRDGLDQRPHSAGQRDAARRLQAVRLWQGPQRLLLGGLHQHQARDGEGGLTQQFVIDAMRGDQQESPRIAQ